MAVVDYKGIQVLSPAPTGDGGLLIQQNFSELTDRIPTCYHTGVTDVDPSEDNDGEDTAGLGTKFYVGSRWINEVTGYEYVCVDNSTGAAVWRVCAPAGTGPAGLDGMFSGAVTVVTTGGPTTPEDKRTYINTGTSVKVLFSLPNTSNTSLSNTYIVDNANGIRITAPTGHTIQMAGSSATKTGGYVESVTVGSTLALLKVTATKWYGVFWFGTWDVETS